MTFLTSVQLGLSIGAGALFSIFQGQGDRERLRLSVSNAFFLILAITLVLNGAVYLWTDPILAFLNVPEEVYGLMREYLVVISPVSSPPSSTISSPVCCGPWATPRCPWCFWR